MTSFLNQLGHALPHLRIRQWTIADLTLILLLVHSATRLRLNPTAAAFIAFPEVSVLHTVAWRGDKLAIAWQSENAPSGLADPFGPCPALAARFLDSPLLQSPDVLGAGHLLLGMDRGNVIPARLFAKVHPRKLIPGNKA